MLEEREASESMHSRIDEHCPRVNCELLIPARVL
jgi:hypothetical protein